MVKLFDVVDEDDFYSAVDNGLVTLRKHPELPLTIAGYTPLCQYSRAWNDTTRACRGLIYDHETMEVVARPFEKFFNWNEPGAPEPPKSDAIRMPKADGSLGIVFYYDGSWHVSTRGSFVSEQAIWAQRWLDEFVPTVHPQLLNPYVTYCTEIVFPQNRIVLDYRGLETLILLDVISPNTGRSMRGEFTVAPFEHKVERVSAPFNPDDILNIGDGEGEGYVYLWPHDNVRLKSKTQWYVDTHRVVTNLTERSVWEMMVSGRSLDEMKESIPEEFYGFVEKTHAEISEKVGTTVAEVGEVYNEIMEALPTGHNRGDFARLASKSPRSKYLFLMLDDKDDKVIDLALKDAKPPATKEIEVE